jgi:hypothetical protein
MKKLILSLILLTAVVVKVEAQPPISWSFSAKKIADKIYEIKISAILSGDWHLYSQTTPDGGPTPTEITFAKNPLVTTEGPIKEVGKMEEHFEPLFGVIVKQFSGKVEFVQKVKLKTAAKTSVNGNIEFMVCNDEECMPPARQPFSISLK